MKRFLAALAAFLIPISALAAFTLPSEILLSPALIESPLDIAHEFHASMEGNYFASLWVRGSVDADRTSIEAATVRMTFDITGPQLSIRTKWQMRVKDSVGYVLLESINGEYDHALARFATSVAGKQWLEIPLSASDLDHALASEEKREETAQLMNALLSVTQKSVREYVLTLKPEAVQTLGAMGEIDEETLQALLSGTLDFTVGLTADGLPASVRHAFSFQADTVGVRGSGLTTLRSNPVVVQIPSNSMTVEEIESTFAPPSLPSFDFDSGTDEEWTVPAEPASDREDLESDDACSSENDAARVMAVRKGLCKNERKSRRRLEN